MNDRIALELGRSKLAQILAEAQRDEALEQLAAAQAEEKDEPKAARGKAS